MKKVFYFFMMLIAVVLISNFSYADYGVPEIIQYDAKIINESGAEALDYSGNIIGVIPAETIVTVLYEHDGKAFIKYNNSDVGIDFKDIKPVSNEINLSKANYYEKEEMYVYREGAYLYNGPSIAYGKVEGDIEIPKGNFVKIEAGTESWGYVEYNGVKGWVYIYTSDYVSPYNMTCSLTNIAHEDYSHYYTIKDITLNSTIGANDNIGTIPAGEHINSYFYSYYPDPHGITIYIEYKDLKGWYTVNEEEVYQDYSSLDITATVSQNCKIYSEILPINPNTYEREFSNNIGTLVANTECKVIYKTVNNYIDYIFIEYNGIEGWVDTDYYSINTDYQKLVDVSQFINKEESEDQIEETQNTDEFIDKNNSIIEKNQNVSDDLENRLLYCVIVAIIIFVVAIMFIKIINKNNKIDRNDKTDNNTKKEE